MLRKLFNFVFMLFISSNLFAHERIVLQLKWEHEFQFAGYYAAKWQGFYADEGLDVEIRSAAKADKSFINPSNELKKGNAQFAIGGLDILISKDKELSPVLLAPIFQRNPSAIFALEKTDIRDLKKLAKLRIATPKSAYRKTEIKSLFRSHGYDLEKINFVDQPVTIATLINDKADAIITYEISAQYAAQEKNIKLNQLNLADFAIEPYGDSLYTSYKYAQAHPDIVEKFTRASKKGWLYALNHKEGVARRIAAEFPRYLVKYDDFYEYNRFFAEHIDSLIQYPEIPLGDINKERWFILNDRMRSIGLLHSYIDDSRFYFQEKVASSSKNALLCILIFLSLIVASWYFRLRILTIFTVLLALFTFEFQLEQMFIKEEKLLEKEKTMRILNSVSGKLQGHLQNNLSMITGFAAYISATPDLSTDDFNRYAKALFQKDPMLVSFVAVKEELIARYVYPLAGNEKVVGLNYRQTPEQLKMIQQVINTGQIQISDPINLVQGGTAFIGRAPIFLEEGKLWGVISAPLNAQLLFKDSGLEQATETLNIAIRRYDTLGNKQKVFLGDAAIFNSQEKLETIITVGNESWHLAALPVKKDAQLSIQRYLLRTAFLLGAVLFAFFIWFKFRQTFKQRKLEQKLRDDKKLLESVGRVAKIGGWKLDNELNFQKWSKQCSLLLQEPRTFRPGNLAELNGYFSPQDYQLWREKVKTALTTSRAFSLELQLVINNQPSVWLRIMSDGKVDRDKNIYGTIQDINEKVVSTKTIEYQAAFDSLTDLPNRRSYQDRLEQAIKNAHRNNQKLAVLFVDLDRFKPINDNHGHQAGDQILMEAATRLKNSLRESDTVARLSGDEFAIILNDINHYQNSLAIAEKVSEAMQEPYQLGKNNIYLSVSIGIAIYPNDADSADALLKKADQAMYEVKASGRNGYQLYTQEMQLKSEHRHDLLNKLIEGIKNRELHPYFQPIIDLNSKQICKCETLARWQLDSGEFIPPDKFIALAEESGLVNKIDLLMLQESSRALTEINADVELSINVSPRLFQTKDNSLLNWLVAIQNSSQSINITVEITERLLTDDSEKALTILNQLKNIGIKIAIDDFGAGYSSLNYLLKFPVDIIKIDRSFVKQIGIDSASEVLIETILSMAKRLSIQVVAEGIETQEQLTYLQKHHCDYGQGYFLGRPMSKEQFYSLLKA